jgi:amino-acid N-acetyltransferase
VLRRDGLLLMRIERATPADHAAIEALLIATGLPLDGADEAFRHGVVGRDERGEVVAAAAVEPYGDAALLRSVVVSAERRGRGDGAAIVAAAEALAREDGAERVFLLTETAQDWFPRLGYQALDRGAVPPAVRQSVEFTTACADTAVAMVKTLEVSEPASARRR